ncbi:hypothetical protein SAMN05216486_10397 [bacterium JGI 053]|nr:hypothetical protein SAMN05216486_10397 [bacterium JGI 053]
MQQDHFDVRAARERLGLTTEALAATLHVTEGEVRGWENGSIRPRRKLRFQLEYLVARADWDAGMTASGIPDCAWLEARLPGFVYGGFDRAQIALGKEIVRHMEACAACRARTAWAREHLPPPPQPPATGFGRLFAATVAGIDRLPKWARPAAFGAIMLALMTSARILFLLPSMLRSPIAVLTALGTVLLAAAAGGVGGLAYSLTRPRLQRLGWVGGYLSGFVSVAAYMGAIGIVALFVLGMPDRRDLVPMLVIGAFCSALFGTLVGKIINDARSHRPEKVDAA